MSTNDKRLPKAASLREQAEKKFRERLDSSMEHLESLSPKTLQAAIHELRVHQIELEMQNEELLRSQADLNAARARYFDLYDLAPVGYCTLAETGLLLEANLTAAALLGVERDALVTMPLSRFILQEDQDAFYRMRKILLETGPPQECELRMRKPDGKIFWAHLTATAAQDETGTPVCRIALSDVTGRKAREEVQAFLARAGSGPTEEPFFNALARYLARSLGLEFLCIDILEGDGLNARTLAVWHDGQFEDNVTYALKDTPCGEVVGREVCCFPASVCQFFPRDQVLKDLRAESYIGVTLWSHTGRPIGLIAAIGRHPLADRPQAEAVLKMAAERASGELERMFAEEALQKSEARVRAITEAAQDAIIMMDPRGKISYWNPAAETIFGYTREEAVGQALHALLVSEPYLSAYSEAFPGFQRTGRGNAVGRTIEMAACRKDGLVIEVALSLSAVALDGEWHSVGIVRDITLRKENDNKLEEALVRAEAAARTKSDFLAMMSHELRTPLNGVLGFAELLANSPLDDEQKVYARTICNSGNHLLAVVNDILDFSSIEKGTLAIQSAPFVTAELVESAAGIIRKSAAAKGLEFHSEIASGVPERITGDERRIRQILINLLGNAVKFTSAGSVVFRIAKTSAGGRAALDFSVKDTGPGMSTEMVSGLFQPFVQGDARRSRVFGGTGIGLAISKRLADAMGGSLAVASTDKGSTFTFRLALDSPARGTGAQPVCSPDIAAPQSLQSQTVEAASCRLGLSGKRQDAASTNSPEQPRGPGDRPDLGAAPDPVLVVDDDKTSSVLAGKMLAALGCRAEFAVNGEEAVKKIRKGKFSAVLMDVAMPVMDGIEATTKIRASEPADRRVPIIAVTADVISGNCRRYLAAGMDDYLSKPFRRAELAEKLFRYIPNPK